MNISVNQSLLEFLPEEKQEPSGPNNPKRASRVGVPIPLGAPIPENPSSFSPANFNNQLPPPNDFAAIYYDILTAEGIIPMGIISAAGQARVQITGPDYFKLGIQTYAINYQIVASQSINRFTNLPNQTETKALGEIVAQYREDRNLPEFKAKLEKFKEEELPLPNDSQQFRLAFQALINYNGRKPIESAMREEIGKMLQGYGSSPPNAPFYLSKIVFPSALFNATQTLATIRTIKGAILDPIVASNKIFSTKREPVDISPIKARERKGPE